MNERKKNAAGAESVGVLTYRAKPLAKSLGIGVSTLWDWVRSGKFPKPLKLGENLTAWRADEVHDWLDKRQRYDRAGNEKGRARCRCFETLARDEQRRSRRRPRGE